jgi:hypothetical protein
MNITGELANVVANTNNSRRRGWSFNNWTKFDFEYW